MSGPVSHNIHSQPDSSRCQNAIGPNDLRMKTCIAVPGRLVGEPFIGQKIQCTSTCKDFQAKKELLGLQ